MRTCVRRNMLDIKKGLKINWFQWFTFVSIFHPEKEAMTSERLQRIVPVLFCAVWHRCVREYKNGTLGPLRGI